MSEHLPTLGNFAEAPAEGPGSGGSRRALPAIKSVAALTGRVEAIVRQRNVANARTARLGFSQPPRIPRGARILS